MILSLQYARGLAALLVVYFHATRQFKAFTPANESFIQFGELGVDIFFVLSGFVMWITTSTSQVGAIEFLKRRAIRIVPLYWSVTIAVGAIALAFPGTLRSTVFDPQHWLASLFFVPWPSPVLSERLAPIVIPGWTLNYEMFFYAAFAAALVLGVRHRAWALALLFVGLFAGATIFGHASPVLGFYGSSIIFEFLLGMVIAMAYERDRLIAAPAAWVLLIVATAVIVVLDISYDNNLPAIARGIPAAAIICALVSIEARTGCFQSRSLLLLGAASFSIYLTHVFTLAGLRVAWKQAGLGVTELYGTAFMAAALVLSVIVGVVVHLYYEQPALAYFKRLLTASGSSHRQNARVRLGARPAAGTLEAESP